MVNVAVVERMDKLVKSLNKISLEMTARLGDYKKGKIWEKALKRETEAKFLLLMDRFKKFIDELKKAE